MTKSTLAEPADESLITRLATAGIARARAIVELPFPYVPPCLYHGFSSAVKLLRTQLDRHLSSLRVLFSNVPDEPGVGIVLKFATCGEPVNTYLKTHHPFGKTALVRFSLFT